MYKGFRGPDGSDEESSQILVYTIDTFCFDGIYYCRIFAAENKS